MGIFVIGDGSLFQKILIDSNETDGVSARNIRYSFDFTSHHENSSLNVLNVEIVFATWNIVGSHNSDLLSTLDDSGENSTEGIESTFIVSGHHLGDEDHKGTFLIAVLDGLSADIINRTLIQVSSSISLSDKGGWEFHNDHL